MDLNSRCTGRTTKMLIELASYIHENWNTYKIISFSSHSLVYSFKLIERILPVLPGYKRINKYHFEFGKVHLFIY
jgi:hypothetical protein